MSVKENSAASASEQTTTTTLMNAQKTRTGTATTALGTACAPDAAGRTLPPN
jgi:hypothetical protein